MRVLMVCLGNICRSPMAEGVLWSIAQVRNLNLEVDSAGTANYHVGESPDHRAIRCMKEYGIDISGLRGRQFNKHDFESFDHILVMDQSNLRNVLALAENDSQRSKVKLMLSYSSTSKALDVPDPWYGGMEDFHNVYAMLTDAAEGFLSNRY
jgi:protein-tyrosine phosphatase